MPVFRPQEYITPTALSEALSILQENGDRAKIVAGGTQVYETAMRGMIAQAEKIVDIEKLGLSYIKEDNGHVRIGAATTFTEILDSTLLEKVCPLMVDAVNHIRPLQVRNAATVGGSICSGLPVFDIPTTLLALDARVKAVSSKGERSLDLGGFFLDYFLTELKPTELLTEIEIPKLSADTKTAFMKLERTYVDLPTVNTAVKLTLEGGKCKVARIALGGVARVPIRAKKAEKRLEGKGLTDGSIGDAAEETAKEVKPIGSIHASAEYKREMCMVLVKRALTKAAGKVSGG
ncbi:MAG: FAD binding domain-containing protein [Candidatus Bathyarchaeia archaeon]